MLFIKTIKSEFLIIAKSKHKMYKLQKQDMFQVPWKVVVFDTHTDDNVVFKRMVHLLVSTEH